MTAQELYQDATSKYLPPSSFDGLVKYKHLPCTSVKAIRAIESLMKKNDVYKAGYGSTSIRGCHNYIVFYR